MKKIKLNQFKLKNKTASYAFMIILVMIVIFSLWTLMKKGASQKTWLDSYLIYISGDTPGENPFDVSDAVFSIQ